MFLGISITVPSRQWFNLGRTVERNCRDSNSLLSHHSGWFMGVTSTKSESPRTAVLLSPEMRQSSPTCRVHLRYFLWDSGTSAQTSAKKRFYRIMIFLSCVNYVVWFSEGHSGLGDIPLWASVHHENSPEAVVWRPEATSIRGWREATIFLGRIPTAFRISLNSQRSEGQKGDVAVDQLEFLDCSLPCQSHQDHPAVSLS